MSWSDRRSPAARERESFYRSKRWKRVRQKVIERDRYQCQEPSCRRLAPSRDLHADHIVEIADGGKPYDMDNLRTLCRGCHTSKSLRERHQRKRIERDAERGIYLSEPDEMGLRWGMSYDERQAAKR